MTEGGAQRLELARIKGLVHPPLLLTVAVGNPY